MSDDMQYGRLYQTIDGYGTIKKYIADCTLGIQLRKDLVKMHISSGHIYLACIYNFFKADNKWYVIYDVTGHTIGAGGVTQSLPVFPDSDTDISKQDAIMNETTSLILGNTLQKDISRLQASLNDIMNMILYAPGNSVFKEV